MPSSPIRQAVILLDDPDGRGAHPGAAADPAAGPLLPCGDRPFLAWMIRELVRFGVEEVLLLAEHLPAVLVAALPAIEASLPKRVAILSAIAPADAGPVGALRAARGRLDHRFLLLRSDTILDFNLAHLLVAGANRPAIALRPIADTDPYPHTGHSRAVQIAGDRVTGFLPRPRHPAPGLIEAGLSLLHRDLLDTVPPTGSLEADILPALAGQGRLGCAIATGWFLDIGVAADRARAPRELPRRLRRPALLLDRDGTLNHDHGWVGSRERWDWIAGAREAVAAATEAGWHVFVVTNQSGIARGLYDEAALAALHGWMVEAIRAAGGTVDDIRHCPFHPEAPLARYRSTTDWRKPGPGMILDLIRVWSLDPARCTMVGDQPSDIAAAQAAGIRGVPFTGGDLRSVVLPLLDRDRG